MIRVFECPSHSDTIFGCSPCFKNVAMPNGVVKPGETVSGSMLGANHPGDYYIDLQGRSGNAPLSVK